MKKLGTGKYFLIIWAVVVAAFNLLVFLITDMDVVTKSWWLTYAFIMVVFVMMLLMRLCNIGAKKSMSVFIPLMLPLLTVTFIMNVIFLFFPKILVLGVAIPNIILLVLVIIGFVFGLMYKENLDNNIPEKKIEVASMEGLIEFLSDLMNHSNDAAVRAKLNELILLAKNEVSDPTNQKVKDLEKRIYEYAYFMKKDLASEDGRNNFFVNAERCGKLLSQRGKM